MKAATICKQCGAEVLRSTAIGGEREILLNAKPMRAFLHVASEDSSKMKVEHVEAFTRHHHPRRRS